MNQKTKIPELKWEALDCFTERARVIGGWLVKISEPVVHIETQFAYIDEGHDSRFSICFVPDPNYMWENHNETS